MNRKIYTILLTIAAIMIFASACGGGSYPFDPAPQENFEISQEIAEGKAELATIEADPCL